MSLCNSIKTKNTDEKGFTLIELMISMALGLVVSIAAVQLFITGVSSYNLQRGVGDVNENGRFALDFINRNIRQYQPDAAQSGSIVVDPLSIPLGTAMTVSFNDQSPIAIGVGRSDQLVARTWITTSDYRDCEGNLVPADNFSIARYFLRVDTPSGSPSALACDAGYYSPSDLSVTNYGDDGVVLLAAVDSFQVMYGVAPVPLPANPAPERYVQSNLVGANAVLAIRLGILVRSAEGVGGFATDPLEMRVLDATLTSAQLKASDNKRVRRVFTSTVALRNVM